MSLFTLMAFSHFGSSHDSWDIDEKNDSDQGFNDTEVLSFDMNFSTDDELCDIELVQPSNRLTIMELVGMFAFHFCNGILISSFFIITLPIESKLISSDNRAIVLACFVAISGLSQLICPIVGLYSDRCQHRYGKRRPFIFYGGIIGTLSLTVQLISRENHIWWLYGIAFLISMLCLNTIYSAMVGFCSC